MVDEVLLAVVPPTEEGPTPVLAPVPLGEREATVDPEAHLQRGEEVAPSLGVLHRRKVADHPPASKILQD